MYNPLQSFLQVKITKMSPSKYSVISSVLLSLFIFFLCPTEEAPIYSSHCCTDSIKYQPNSTFQTNLNLLLSSLSSNATKGNHFYKTRIGSDTPDEVKGLFLCRGDTLTAACYGCVAAAAKEIKRLCPVEKEAIIWYDTCMLRYSNQSLNNIVPGVDLSNSKSVASTEHDRFNELLAGLLNDLATKAANSGKEKFATGEVNFTSTVKLYGLVECTPELSLFDCNMCFSSAIASVPNCCDGKQGARVLLPGCNIRYELYQFYNSTETLTHPVLQSRPLGTIGHIIVVYVIGMLIIVFYICFFGFHF